MRLDGLWVASSEDLKQDFIRDEIETSKECSLVLEIGDQTLLALVKLTRDILQLIETVGGFSADATLEHIWRLVDTLHDLLVVCVSLVELFVLLWQRQSNIFTREDGEQVDPFPLDIQPSLYDIEYSIQVELPLCQLLPHTLSVLTSSHCLEDQDVVLQLLFDLIW